MSAVHSALVRLAHKTCPVLLAASMSLLLISVAVTSAVILCVRNPGHSGPSDIIEINAVANGKMRHTRKDEHSRHWQQVVESKCSV